MFRWEFRFTTVVGTVTDWVTVTADSFEAAKAHAAFMLRRNTHYTGLAGVR